MSISDAGCTAPTARAYLAHAPAEELRQIALEGGMLSMRQDALDKVAAGLTSLDEMARAVV